MLGGIVVVVSFGLGAVLILRGLNTDASLEQMWPLLVGALFLCLGLLFGYWTWGCISMCYIIDRNSLSIRWGSMRQIVPLSNIERLIPGAADNETPNIEGVNWPGHHVGRGDVPTLGPVMFYSTHKAMDDVLYVQTPTETYAISVPDQIAFAKAVQENQMRGPLFEQRQEVQRTGVAVQSFWLDSTARLLTVLLIGAFIVAAGYVLKTYPGLDQSVALRFPAFGGVARVTDKSELLDIPRSAAAFVCLNLVLAVALHPWERMVSYVLLLAGIALEVTLLVAAIVAVA